jgi:sec-independent protein translocase protein TatA
MPQIGPLEILVVMVVALLVFGPEKLPEMARNLGRTATQLRRMAQDMKDEFSTALDDDEEDEDRPAPGSASSRPRAAGALPGKDDAVSDVGEDGDDRSTLHDAAPEDAAAIGAEDDESSSINDDLERLNRQQREAEAATTTGRMEDPKVERAE